MSRMKDVIMEFNMSLKYENIIKQMTLAEKAQMMSGKNTWQTVILKNTVYRRCLCLMALMV